MKRQIAVLLCVLAAVGCARWTDIDSDAFDMGKTDQEHFTLDSQACASQGENARSFSVQGADADNIEKRRLYNHAFAACMRTKGYRQRGSWLDLSDTFDF
jgi:hypothetical protein